jgi:hypothetical protein
LRGVAGGRCSETYTTTLKRPIHCNQPTQPFSYRQLIAYCGHILEGDFNGSLHNPMPTGTGVRGGWKKD